MRRPAQLSVRCRYIWSALPMETDATQSAYNLHPLRWTIELYQIHVKCFGHMALIVHLLLLLLLRERERVFRTKLAFILWRHLYFWAIIRMCDCGQKLTITHTRHKYLIITLNIFSVNLPSVRAFFPYKFWTYFIFLFDDNKMAKRCDTVWNETRTEAVATANTRPTRWPTIR